MSHWKNENFPLTSSSDRARRAKGGTEDKNLRFMTIFSFHIGNQIHIYIYIYIYKRACKSSWISRVKRSGVNGYVWRNEAEYFLMCAHINHGPILQGFKYIENHSRKKKTFNLYESAEKEFKREGKGATVTHVNLWFVTKTMLAVKRYLVRLFSRIIQICQHHHLPRFFYFF